MNPIKSELEKMLNEELYSSHDEILGEMWQKAK